MYTLGQYSKEYGTRDGSSRPQEDGKEANSVVQKFIVNVRDVLYCFFRRPIKCAQLFFASVRLFLAQFLTAIKMTRLD